MLKTIIPFLIAFSSIWSQTLENAYVKTFPLTSAEGLELINVTVDEVEYIGKEGIQVSGIEGKINVEYLAIVPDIIFKDGIIEIELTGEPAPNADPQMRGFVGIAFRIDTSNYSSYECFYLRPTNARADDQLRRNHSVQYVSHPEYPWYKLRNDSPGLYESYVDLVPGEWTKIKIEVTRRVAKLYVHGSEQPCLIVNDLKHDVSEGKIALWLHTSTLARYRNLVVTSN